LEDKFINLLSKEDKKELSLEDKLLSGILEAINLEFENLSLNSEKHISWIWFSIKSSPK
jgi:hypothetical protein